MTIQLKILKVHNHGKAKEEYVLIKVIEDCDLSNYAIIDSTFDSEETISNKNRHIYWFPQLEVLAGEIVSLRTGEGNNNSYVNDQKIVVHRFYWGLKASVWNDSGDAATLIQISDWSSKQVK